MNKLLLYSMFLFFLARATEATRREGLLGSYKLDFAQMFKINEGLNKDSEYFKVHECDVNHVLHAMNHDTHLNNFDELKQIQVTQLSNSQHMLMSGAYLKGGGINRAAAAGFWLSKFAFHAAVQVLYAIIAGATSLVYPPAAPVVYCSLQLTFATLVEIASNMVANGYDVKVI